jgi:hypothetical protein
METDNAVVTKQELITFQLITKLEDNVELLTDKLKQYEKSNSQLLMELNDVKKENVKLNEGKRELLHKVADLENECHTTVTESQEHIDKVDGEVLDAHDLILDIRKDIFSDEVLLAYLGKKADYVLSEAYNNGQTILKFDYLKNLDFPLILLVELTNEEFGILTTNFKLVRSTDTDYKLTKNSNKNGNKIEVQKNPNN